MGGRAVSIVLVGALGCGVLACTGMPESRGTPEEAQAMLQKATDHYAKVGRQRAFADFNRKEGGFVDRDLYVFCISQDHTIVANGGFPNLVGTAGDAVRDAQGKSLALAMWRAVEGTGEGIVEYTWASPVTSEVERKVSFVRKIGDDLCGVGAYNPTSMTGGGN